MSAPNPIEGYLVQVSGAMRGMEPRVRNDILRELRSHITEAASANGGDVGRAIATMGSASQVGREYRNVYGFGRGFVLFFAAVAFLLALPSSPILQVTAEFPVPNVLAIPVLIVLAAWILWVSVAAGSRAGLLAGAGAFLGRTVVEVVLAATPPYPAPTAAGLALFVAAGALLVVLGWLPGTAKKAWSKPSGEL